VKLSNSIFLVVYTITIKVNLNECLCMCTCRFTGRYVHTHQEGGRTVDGEVNQTRVQQDLDQSPKEPKASVESEEGKHRFHLTLFD
jgi:hypothetical protein